MRSIELKSLGRSLVIGLGLLLATGVAQAAPPKVNYLFPAGGQIGQSVEVTLSGEFPDWPVNIWSDHPGVAATAGSDKGKVTVQIASDARPSVAWLRFYSAAGASTLQPFILGTLAEIEEKEPNNAPSNPQQVTAGTVINGRLQKGGDLDSFKVTLKQGETLVASLQTHTLLGSPVDSVLQVCELSERKALADAPPQVEAYILQQEHDSVGLDPRLAFTAPKDGDYLVRIFGFPSEPNSTIGYSGADSYVYRLTLTTGPVVLATLPMAAVGSESTKLNYVGYNLPSAGLASDIPALEGDQSPVDQRSVTATHPEALGFVQLARVESTVLVAAPDISLEKPQPIPVPAVVTGQLSQPGSIHSFELEVKKGSKLHIAVEGSSLGFPWDPHLSVWDSAGKQLTEIDDARRERDPQLTFNPPADGKYRVVVRDLNRHGGLDFIYRLNIEQASDFSLTLSADNFVLPTDKPLEIPVTIDRRDGFAEPIHIRVAGLPEDVSCETVTSEAKGDSSKSVKLILKAEGDRAMLPDGPIRIEGVAAESQRRRVATFDLAKPLAGEHTAAWLTIGR